MPSYEYPVVRSPYVGSISDLIAREGEIRARAALQSGQAWAGATQQIGQAVGGALQEIADPKRQMEQIALKDAQRTQAGQAQVAKLMTPQIPNGPQPEGAGPAAPQNPYLDESGLFNVPHLTQALAASGFADKAPELLKSAEMINDSILKHQKVQQDAADRKTVMLGDLADGLQKAAKAGIPLDQAFDFVTMPAVATGRFSQQEAAATTAKLLALPPEQRDVMLGSLMDAAAQVSPEKDLSKDAERLDRYNRVKATNIVPEKPNEAEIALRAAGGDPAKAMDLLKPKPAPTEASMDAAAQALLAKKALGQPLTPGEAANLQAYQERKRTVSDPALLASMDRQEKTIAAQVASQSRAQSFAEAQAGRKELGEKIEQPYQTAVASANTLRDVVAAAKNGNKVAASLQSLETTMSAIRAQGLNRINTAEIGVAANAGSLWDNIVGKVGKLAAGEPIPADLQKDMTDFADILEKAAYKKYEGGWDATTKRYNLTDEQKLAPPQAPARGTPGTVGGKAAVWDYRDGKWGWYAH